MTDRVPSVFILVPGPWRDPEEVQRLLVARGIPATVGQAGPIKSEE